MTRPISLWPTFVWWFYRKTGKQLPVHAGVFDTDGLRLRRLTKNESEQFRIEAARTRDAWDRAHPGQRRQNIEAANELNDGVS